MQVARRVSTLTVGISYAMKKYGTASCYPNMVDRGRLVGVHGGVGWSIHIDPKSQVAAVSDRTGEHDASVDAVW